MKAKKIKESLNFEREKNPIKSMVIGQEFKYKELEQEFSNSFPELSVSYINLNSKGKRIRSFTKLNDNKQMEIGEWFLKHPYFEIEDIRKERSYFGDTYYEIDLREKNLKESLNFERGKDPKESMNIGGTLLDKKLIEKIKKSLENVVGDMGDSFKYFPGKRKIEINQDDFIYTAVSSIQGCLNILKNNSLKDKIKIIYENPKYPRQGILTVQII